MHTLFLGFDGKRGTYMMSYLSYKNLTIFLISQPKHMLCGLKRTLSMRRRDIFKQIDKKKKLKFYAQKLIFVCKIWLAKVYTVHCLHQGIFNFFAHCSRYNAYPSHYFFPLYDT